MREKVRSRWLTPESKCIKRALSQMGQYKASPPLSSNGYSPRPPETYDQYVDGILSDCGITPEELDELCDGACEAAKKLYERVAREINSNEGDAAILSDEKYTDLLCSHAREEFACDALAKMIHWVLLDSCIEARWIAHEEWRKKNRHNHFSMGRPELPIDYNNTIVLAKIPEKVKDYADWIPYQMKNYLQGWRKLKEAKKKEQQLSLQEREGNRAKCISLQCP